jgi:hypothetical protein
MTDSCETHDHYATGIFQVEAIMNTNKVSVRTCMVGTLVLFLEGSLKKYTIY